MRLPKALITYSEYGGVILKRQSVDVQYTRGEPHPKDRVISIELDHKGGIGRCINVGIKTFEKATGLKITIPKGR